MNSQELPGAIASPGKLVGLVAAGDVAAVKRSVASYRRVLGLRRGARVAVDRAQGLLRGPCSVSKATPLLALARELNDEGRFTAVLLTRRPGHSGG